MSKVAIIISSCDAFKECWEPMIYSLDKYWPDCEYHKYIISVKESIDGLRNTTFIKTGNDMGWASNIRFALDRIDSEYVIYFQEDYFLCNHVNNEEIKNHLSHCIKENVDFLKLNNDTMTRDNARIGNSIYCVNKPNIRYSINTAIGIWRKEALMRVCIPGQTGWDFEHNIIKYLRENKIYIKSEVLYSKEIPFRGFTYVKDGAIVKGMWTKSGINFLEHNGFTNLIPMRPHVGKITTIIGNLANRYKILRYPIWPILKLMRKCKINI